MREEQLLVRAGVDLPSVQQRVQTVQRRVRAVMPRQPGRVPVARHCVCQ